MENKDNKHLRFTILGALAVILFLSFVIYLAQYASIHNIDRSTSAMRNHLKRLFPHQHHCHAFSHVRVLPADASSEAANLTGSGREYDDY